MFNTIDWEDAINIRRSARSFEMRPVESSKLDLIQNFADNIKIPFEHNVKIRMLKASTDKKLYTVFTSPPDGMAFLAETDVCSLARVGFIGELLILYATSLGLATCWYGHYDLRELERVMPHLGEHDTLPMPKWGYGKTEVKGERAVCISPLGYWKKDGVRFFDRITETFISYKRKTIGALLEDDQMEETMPKEFLYALDLARKAPSAANSQHWKFSASPDLKTVYITMDVGYKHVKWEHPNVDLGICACHFWLGLRLKGIESWVSITEDQGRAIWKFET